MREDHLAIIVLAHGGWSAAWAWKKVRPLMAAAGHHFFTPTYTGLGERAHLASPSNDLETRIQDLLGVLKFEDLREVVLIGHSYGGMVATGVADRARDRMAELIYLDAFVPTSGQALIDLVPSPSGNDYWIALRQGTAGALHLTQLRPIRLQRIWNGSASTGCRSR